MTGASPHCPQQMQTKEGDKVGKESGRDGEGEAYKRDGERREM